MGRARFRRSWTACAAPGGASRGRPDPEKIGMARFRRSWGVWRRPGGACGGGNDGDARRPISVGRRESASVGVGRRNAVMSNAVDAAAPARCAGGAVVSRRVGGVLTGVLAPLASSRAPSASRAAPPARGGRGEVGKGADRRAWGVWRGPGGAGGCAVVIPWRGFRCFTPTTYAASRTVCSERRTL